MLQGILDFSTTTELYVKHMGKHFANMDHIADDFLGKTLNFILIRNPVDALASFEKVIRQHADINIISLLYKIAEWILMSLRS